VALFFILIGIALLISGFKGTSAQLVELLREAFQPAEAGVTPFGLWIVALVAVGAIGYSEKLKPVSNAFLALVFIALILSNRGFFNQFRNAVGIR
jgi:hypothetical protein